MNPWIRPGPACGVPFATTAFTTYSLTISRVVHPLERARTISFGPNFPLSLSHQIYPLAPHSISFCERYMPVLLFSLATEALSHTARYPYPCTTTHPDFARVVVIVTSRNPLGWGSLPVQPSCSFLQFLSCLPTCVYSVFINFPLSPLRLASDSTSPGDIRVTLQVIERFTSPTITALDAWWTDIRGVPTLVCTTFR